MLLTASWGPAPLMEKVELHLSNYANEFKISRFTDLHGVAYLIIQQSMKLPDSSFKM